MGEIHYPSGHQQICPKESRFQLMLRSSSSHVVEKHLPRKILKTDQYCALELCPLQLCCQGEFLTIGSQKTRFTLIDGPEEHMGIPKCQELHCFNLFLAHTQKASLSSHWLEFEANVPNCFLFLFREMVKCEYMIICGLASSWFGLPMIRK